MFTLKKFKTPLLMKLLALLTLLITLTLNTQAQKAKPKPKGKAPVKKGAKGKTSTKVKTTGDSEYDLFICYEGGGPCTFTILKGDTLVYDVNQSGKSYQLMVIPNKFDANLIADFNWLTSAPDNRAGKVTVNTTGLKTASKYMTNLPAGDLKLTDASAFWISEKTFKEITTGKSSIAFDGGNPENFSSPEADESNVTIAYKAKQISLEGFAIQNKPLGQNGRKEISILNISQNLLILKADLDNGSMVLKEVRANKAR